MAVGPAPSIWIWAAPLRRPGISIRRTVGPWPSNIPGPPRRASSWAISPPEELGYLPPFTSPLEGEPGVGGGYGLAVALTVCGSPRQVLRQRHRQDDVHRVLRSPPTLTSPSRGEGIGRREDFSLAVERGCRRMGRWKTALSTGSRRGSLPAAWLASRRTSCSGASASDA